MRYEDSHPIEHAAVNDRWHELSVECHAGYRGEETPVRFQLGDRAIEIDEVLDRWLAPDIGFSKSGRPRESTSSGTTRYRASGNRCR
jgi:hypothetical protein